MNDTTLIYTYAFAVLFIVLIGSSLPKYVRRKGQGLFRTLVVLNMTVLALDLVAFDLIAMEGTLVHLALQAVTLLIYLIPTLLVLTWFGYVYTMIYDRLPGFNRGVLLFLIPASIDVILVFSSLFSPVYFDICAENTYARGDFYFVSVAIQYLYFVGAAALIVLNIKKMRRTWFYPLMLFSLFPMVAGLIQALNYGMLIVYPTLSLSILMVYIFIQSMWASLIDKQRENARVGFQASQIRQHFIYNTINTIVSVSNYDGDEARALLMEFSNYLRARINFKGVTQFVSLKKEIEIAQAYTRIEKARFGERLDIRFEYPKEELDTRIPFMTVQPILENAVNHGLLPKPEGGRVDIVIEKHGDRLDFTVRDDGVGMQKPDAEDKRDSFSETEGIGLWNINARLESLYGEGLRMKSDTNGTEFFWSVPL